MTSIFNPMDVVNILKENNITAISINKRERMWRFLNDDEKETEDEISHDEIMREGYHDAYEMSEDVRENLR